MKWQFLGGPGTGSSRVDRCLPLLLGVIAVAPYLSLPLSGELVLQDIPYSDYGSYQLPVREFVQAEISDGRFPHWIPWIGCGLPLHATQQVGVCYPLLTPLLFVLDANMSIKVALFAHAIICYIGQYRLGRRLNLESPGAALSALIATQSGFFATHLAVGHVSLVLAYALLPWLLESTIAICRDPSILYGCWFAVIVSLLLVVGHPQVPYYGFLFAGLWALGSLISGEASTRRMRVVFTFSLALLLGVMIAAVQLCPTLALLADNGGQTTRGTVDYASTYALNGLDLYRFIVPSLLGNPLQDVPEFTPPDFYHEKVSYSGLLTLVLSGVAVFSAFSKTWPWGAFFLVGLGTVISLGDSTPMFEWLCDVIPGLSLFRCPGRCLSIVTILMALLAGRGFDALVRGAAPLSPRSEIRLGCVLLLVGGAGAFIINDALEHLELTRWLAFSDENLSFDLHVSGAVFLSAVSLIAFVPRFSTRTVTLVVTLVMLCDLAYFNLRCIRFEEDGESQIANAMVLKSSQERFVDGGRRFISDEVRYSRLVPLAVRSQSRMLGTNEGGVLPKSCEDLFAALDNDPRTVLRAASCNYIGHRGREFSRVSDEPLPRIWFCPKEMSDELNRPIASLSSSDIDTLNDVAHATPVTVVVDAPQQVIVELAPPTDGILVIADTHYPEWDCWVDGQEESIRKAFGCFRGIPVGSGQHVIEMNYRPESFVRGLQISVCGLSMWIALLGVSLFSNRPTCRPTPSNVKCGGIPGNERSELKMSS